MLLYHGSNTEVAEPRLLDQIRGLDFGQGFYTTTDETQAVRFSGTVRNRLKRGTPIVSVFEFDMKVAVRTLSTRKFGKADAEWLQFVAFNRRKTYQGEHFDIVIGPVANDDVMPTIQAYLSGFLNESATLLALKTSKLVDQVCLKSENALSLLRFVRSFETKCGGSHG
jgi:hypothetical protein